MAVPRLFLCMKTVRPRAVPELKVKNKIGHEIIKKTDRFPEFFKHLKLLIRILMCLISTYAPEYKKYRKIGPKLFIYIFFFPDR